MNRFWKTIVLAAVIVGGLWVLMNQDRIQQAGGLTALIQQSIDGAGDWSNSHRDQNAQRSSGNFFTTASTHASSGSPENPSSPWQREYLSNQPRLQSAMTAPKRLPNSIRVASFKMNTDATRQSKPYAMEVLTHLCSQFDIVAFQEIDGRSDAWLAEIGKNVAAATQGTVQFHALTDRSKIKMGQPQFAILYNAKTLELDQSQWYSVNDPDNLLAREPLVGWFRARNAPPGDAFTFTLANLQLDNHRPDLELAYIGELFRAIRNDGRGEDDVIIVGNFNAGDRGLSPLRKKAGLNWVVFDTPTSTDKAHQFDNLIFSPTATVEFTGQGGVLDFLAAYNLRYDQAVAISDHMPIWAEFSAIEGNTTPVSTPR
jgi:endonuclease/exonuclease/phosphatase family metal-dependent hydrolase